MLQVDHSRAQTDKGLPPHSGPVVVCLAILQQLVRPRSERGALRAVPFDFGERDSPRDAGRRALGEALGSLAPNTIVVGIDPEHNLILAHQLYLSGGSDAVDVLGLG